MKELDISKEQQSDGKEDKVDGEDGYQLESDRFVDLLVVLLKSNHNCDEEGHEGESHQ